MRKRQAKFNSFFRGKQYSRREIFLLRKAGLLPLVINVVKPLLSQRRAILTSSKPTWRVVPLQGGSKLIADFAQQFMVGKWNSDYIDTQLNLALKDMLVVGVGWLFVDLASFLDNATFDIKVRKIPWPHVFPDPHAEEFDLSDAENIILRRYSGIKRAQVVFRMTEEQAQEATYDPEMSLIEGTGPDTRRVLILERYSKFPIKKYEVTPRPGEMLRDLPTVFYTSELKKITDREERELAAQSKMWARDMTALHQEGKIDLRELDELNIYRCMSVGSHDVYSGIMNIRDYPVVPFINEHGDYFMEAQGDTEPIEGIQKAINKFYLLTLHNAMLTGNVRFMGPENAVKNKTQFRATASIPGSYLGYTPDPTLPNGGKPEIVQGGSVSSAFYQLAQDLLERAKFETSIYNPVLGNPSGTPQTFATTASLQDFGTQPIKEIARRVDIQIAKCGEIVLQFLQNYTSANELIEYVDYSGGSSAIRGDEQMTPEQQQQMIMLNQIIVKEGIVKEIKNNTRIGKYAVKVLTQPNLGSDRMIKAAFLRDMLMNKAIPPTPAVIALLLDLMEVPGADKITAELGGQADLEQAKKMIEEMQKKNQQLEQQNMDLLKQKEIDDFKGQARDILNEMRTKGKEFSLDSSQKAQQFLDSLTQTQGKGNGENNQP